MEYWQVVVTYQFRAAVDRVAVTSDLFTSRDAAVAAVEAGAGQSIMFASEPNGILRYYPSMAQGYQHVPGIWCIVIQPMTIDDAGRLLIATLKTAIEVTCNDDERRQREG